MKKNYSIRWREIVKLSFLSFALLISNLVVGQAPTNGLMLYYNFETVAGGVVPDVTGNSLNGTTVGAATVVPGFIGSGINFPTVATPAADYIQLPNGITGTLTDFTISTRIKMDKVEWWMRVFDFGGGTDNYMFLTARGGALKFAFKNGGGEEAISGSDPLEVGRWVHVAVTCSYAGGVGTGRLYLDGVVVGANNNITITPAMLDGALGQATTQNYIGKAQFNDAGLNGTIDEFRIYNRALSPLEIETSAYPSELITQTANLLQGVDLTAVDANLTLPATLGGVSVVWSSNNTAVLSNEGVVKQPGFIDATVILTATLSYTADNITYTRKKDFTVNIPAFAPTGEQLAKWDFSSENISLVNGEITVKDISGNNLTGVCKNVASIRTIGKKGETQFNVLDLGNDNGYFDMGLDIGKYIYALGNSFTVGIYYYVDPSYTKIDWWGNCLWNFANSKNINADLAGAMFLSLKFQGYGITPTYWGGVGGETLLKKDSNAPLGVWKHIAYAQDADTGRIFIDGVLEVSGLLKKFPSTTLAKYTDRTGTIWNTIGYPAYSGDTYLQQALVYGMEVYRVPVTANDLVDVSTLNVTSTLAALNAAYLANPKDTSVDLYNEWNTFTLGDLSNVTSDIVLPTVGKTYPSISILWKTNSGVISAAGVVTRPDYMDAKVVLTATFTINGQTRTKSFSAVVPKKAGTGYAGDLLLNYDFATTNVAGEVVTDAAEKHFTGKLMKGAVARTIGPDANKQNVLHLDSDSAYFDMGTECGKVIYGLNDYSISVYYAIDVNKTNLGVSGNFVYVFANSANSAVDLNGYMFGRVPNAIQCVSSQYWALGNMQTMDRPEPFPTAGIFHHFVYTQKGLVGTAYLDGDTVRNISTGGVASGSFTNLPSEALPKAGMFGTVANFIGRPNFVGDAYLGKAMVADLKLYGKALTKDDIDAMQSKTGQLSAAYDQFVGIPEALRAANKLRVNTTIPGFIQILDLKGNEKVAIYDVMGRKVLVNNVHAITVKPGMYIVKVNEKVTKVLVK